MKGALLPLVPALWLAAVQLPWPLELRPPLWLERVLYNPRERTAQGVEAYEAGRFEASADSMEAALRLAGGAEPPAAGEPEADPRLLYNAGTARLAAGDERRAVAVLERAAAALAEAESPPAGAPPVHYNLGSSRLEAGDPAGAIEALKEALRRDPRDEDAKHNLEVALRRLEEQRKLPLRRPRETPGGDREGEREQGERGGPREPSEGERASDAADPGEGEGASDRDRPEGPADDRGGRDGETRERPLPRFEDQPDMTAESAAALLEAVENLERRQRQLEAAERARREARGRKDW